MVVRALIDPASEGSFISERVVQTLALARQPSSITISGVGGGGGGGGGEISAKSNYLASIILRSRISSNACLSFSAAVLPRLRSLLPRREVKNTTWNHLQGLPLADPDFSNPAQIDCIIVAEAYPSLVFPGLRRGTAGGPVAQNTRLGWILVGPTTPDATATEAPAERLCCTTRVAISTELRRFWKIEELCPKSRRSPAEEECEDHFRRTHQRDNTGRYIVRLPFRQTPSLRDSRSVALHRLLTLERRLARDPALRESYTDFISEYARLHHLEEIPRDTINESPPYYLPHHAVTSADGRKKLRVVFNASQVTPSGLSLNECLHQGEALQADICTILTRWRKFSYVFTADIVKMFRQILIDPEDSNWQRILWRSSPFEEVRDFRLLTVTYGTTSAPFLALCVLK